MTVYSMTTIRKIFFSQYIFLAVRILLDQVILLKTSPCSFLYFVPSSGYLSSHKRRGNPQINFFISDTYRQQLAPQPSSTAPTTFINTKFIYCSTMGDQSAYMPAPGSLPAKKGNTGGGQGYFSTGGGYGGFQQEYEPGEAPRPAPRQQQQGAAKPKPKLPPDASAYM